MICLAPVSRIERKPAKITIGLQLLSGEVQEISVLHGIRGPAGNGNGGGHSGRGARRHRRAALDDDPSHRQEADAGLITAALRTAVQHKGRGAIRGKDRLGGPVKRARHRQNAIHRQVLRFAIDRIRRRLSDSSAVCKRCRPGCCPARRPTLPTHWDWWRRDRRWAHSTHSSVPS